MEFLKKFLEKIITTEDLNYFLEEIETSRKLLFREIDLPLSKRLEGKVSKDFQKFVERMEELGKISKDLEKSKDFFFDFKNYLQKIPRVKLLLAFKPRREFLEKISEFLEKELGKKIILDVLLNPEIVGGVVLEYEGKYLNLSLLKKIENFLKIYE